MRRVVILPPPRPVPKKERNIKRNGNRRKVSLLRYRYGANPLTLPILPKGYFSFFSVLLATCINGVNKSITNNASFVVRRFGRPWGKQMA